MKSLIIAAFALLPLQAFGLTGTITEWNLGKGFGFIQSLDRPDAKKVFFHLTVLERSSVDIRYIDVGTCVDFSVAKDADGRYFATAIKIVSSDNCEFLAR